MAITGLLVLTNPNTISRILPVIKEHVQQTLYVQLSPQRQLIPPWIFNNDVSLKPPHFRKVIVGIYSQTARFCHNLDVRVLLSSIKNPFQSIIKTKRMIDVVIFDKSYSSAEVDNFLQRFLSNATPSCQIITLDGTSENFAVENNSVNGSNADSSTFEMDKIDSKIYENVVLGGTFDRLHSGHKILLTEALLRCSKQLTVGVTDVPMLKSKILWELIDPCANRISCVKDFVVDVDPSVEYNIVPISDPFGPTKEDPNLQMIVVSAETYKGGLKVNEIREKNSLHPLDIVSVDLLEAEPIEYDLEETKISSSNSRLRLLGTRLRNPEAKPHLPLKPYVIGLTGCIASGKTAIGKRLEELGAGVINCDTLAHSLYEKGKACHKLLVQHFGDSILDDHGEVDRKVLGNIVFKNKTKLEELNNILWPVMLDNIKERTQELYRDGKNVVIIEAAILIQAGWVQHCHEIWVSIVPREEVVKRLQTRNGLSPKDAESRLQAQPSNSELVNQAHVVFCSLWEPTFTQKQVEKAWKNLLTSIDIQAKL